VIIVGSFIFHRRALICIEPIYRSIVRIYTFLYLLSIPTSAPLRAPFYLFNMSGQLSKGSVYILLLLLAAGAVFDAVDAVKDEPPVKTSAGSCFFDEKAQVLKYKRGNAAPKDGTAFCVLSPNPATSCEAAHVKLDGRECSCDEGYTLDVDSGTCVGGTLLHTVRIIMYICCMHARMHAMR
jgi:hypothetical protein